MVFSVALRAHQFPTCRSARRAAAGLLPFCRGLGHGQRTPVVVRLDVRSAGDWAYAREKPNEPATSQRKLCTIIIWARKSFASLKQSWIRPIASVTDSLSSWLLRSWLQMFCPRRIGHFFSRTRNHLVQPLDSTRAHVSHLRQHHGSQNHVHCTVLYRTRARVLVPVLVRMGD